jgi:hypothetical protein
MIKVLLLGYFVHFVKKNGTKLSLKNIWFPQSIYLKLEEKPLQLIWNDLNGFTLCTTIFPSVYASIKTTPSQLYFLSSYIMCF